MTLADHVVGDIVVRRARRALELLGEHGEEDRVAARPSVSRLEAAAQHALLREAELARDRKAALVPRLDLDVDPLESAELEADARLHRGHLGRDPAADRVGGDPVADLERALAAAQVEAAAAELLRLIAVEDAVGEVRAEVELATEASKELHLLVDRLRLEADPRHPRAQVLDTGVDRLLEQRRVARVVAADHEPVGLDPVRRCRAHVSCCVAAATVPSRAVTPTRSSPAASRSRRGRPG